jgi:hypothetical protein
MALYHKVFKQIGRAIPACGVILLGMSQELPRLSTVGRAIDVRSLEGAKIVA